jgi:hypothetical protein
MTNEPTPETDAIAFPVGNRSVHPQTVVVAVNDARALEIQRNAARAERDEHIARNNDSLLALHLTTTERDEARADIARLRTALDGMLIAEMKVRQMAGYSADEVEAEPHWMAARAELATPAK